MHVQNTAEIAASTTERTTPYHVAEIAEMVGVHRVTVYRDIAAGRLKALRIGKGKGTLRIPPAALKPYLELLEAQAVTAPTVAEVAR
jgi:excisionase family DNA binding protein